jgi:uncharacterized membrane protein YsdA (DUF1294 family)
MTLWQVYLLEINVVVLLLCALDKVCARRNAWRVPEATLLLCAALGGAGSLLAGMILFRHKTKHKRFVIGVPLILISQITAVYFLGKL